MRDTERAGSAAAAAGQRHACWAAAKGGGWSEASCSCTPGSARLPRPYRQCLPAAPMCWYPAAAEAEFGSTRTKACARSTGRFWPPAPPSCTLLSTLATAERRRGAALCSSCAGHPRREGACTHTLAGRLDAHARRHLCSMCTAHLTEAALADDLAHSVARQCRGVLCADFAPKHGRVVSRGDAPGRQRIGCGLHSPYPDKCLGRCAYTRVGTRRRSHCGGGCAGRVGHRGWLRPSPSLRHLLLGRLSLLLRLAFLPLPLLLLLLLLQHRQGGAGDGRAAQLRPVRVAGSGLGQGRGGCPTRHTTRPTTRQAAWRVYRLHRLHISRGLAALRSPRKAAGEPGGAAWRYGGSGRRGGGRGRGCGVSSGLDRSGGGPRSGGVRTVAAAIEEGATLRCVGGRGVGWRFFLQSGKIFSREKSGGDMMTRGGLAGAASLGAQGVWLQARAQVHRHGAHAHRSAPAAEAVWAPLPVRG